IPIRDSELQDISKYFEETYMFIQNVLDHEDKTILVHWYVKLYYQIFLELFVVTCLSNSEMGISRSPTVVIAYIMRSQKKPLKDALAFVQGKRFIAQPNRGFYKQLKKFESELSLNNDADQNQN
ncbi:13688_t:CDS:2, partial [Cetraspora pellucida]